jgi:hypothetical protein
MILYHRTSQEAASAILADGFQDVEGTYLTCNVHRGVWLADRPLDENEGAFGNVVLKVEGIDERTIADCEWIEDGKPYREWLIPAAVLNETGRTSIFEIDPEPFV